MVLKKRNKGLKFLILSFLLAGWVFQSCTDEGIIDAPTWHQAVESGDNALVRDAKAMVDGTQGGLSMPDMFKTLGKAQTRAAGSTPQTLASGSFTLGWNVAQSFHEEDGTVLLVPIKMKQNMAVQRFSVINNKRKAEQTPMHSVLYVKKFNSTGYVLGRVFSYAPSRQYIKKHPKYKNEMDWYNPEHTDYSGLLLISSLDGTLIHGYNYEDGHRQYMFRPNRHTHEHHHECASITRALTVTDSCLHDHATDNRVTTIQAPVFNMRMVSSTSAINTSSYSNETPSLPNCAICGKNPYYCNCLEVVVCRYCGKVPESCTCKCPKCGEYVCVCDDYCFVCGSWNCVCENVCPLCNSSICICGIGGSTNPGGNNSSGNTGGSTGNDENPTGGDNSSPTTSITPTRIIQATKNSVKKVTEKFGKKKAYCNKGVDYAFQELIGSTELSNKNANTIVRHWISSPNWTEITISEAQSYANKGFFTVAGWINTSLRPDGTEQSGHVVVIVPGETQKGWGSMDLPCAMDTGGGMRAEKQKLSLSFGKAKKDAIRFFYYNK